MRVRQFLFMVAAAMVAGSPNAYAQLLIPTNLGNGADAEVREEQGSADFSGFVTGTNRGNNSELASRLGTTQNSISFAKFDISGLPPTADSFWATNDRVFLDLFARQNGNFSQLTGTNAAGDPVDLTFNVLALDPNGTYSAMRTDRSGNMYTASHNNYDWAEGNGTAGSGIDFYDAPGIQPFCKNANNCAGGATFNSTVGAFDDFDSNAILLGEIVPIDQHPGVSALSGGDRLSYAGSNLRDLVLAAIDAGHDTVTIMVHHKGPRADTVQSALGRNYLFAPKEHMTLSGPGGTMLDNSTGDFSPTLRIVPEPASLMLLALSCLGWLAVRRRS